MKINWTIVLDMYKGHALRQTDLLHNRNGTRENKVSYEGQQIHEFGLFENVKGYVSKRLLRGLPDD